MRVCRSVERSSADFSIAPLQFCSRAGATLVFSGIAQTLHTILKQAQFFPRPGIMFFSDLDHGLEWIEDHKLLSSRLALANEEILSVL